MDTLKAVILDNIVESRATIALMESCSQTFPELRRDCRQIIRYESQQIKREFAELVALKKRRVGGTRAQVGSNGPDTD